MHIALVLTQSLESPSGLGRYWPVARELAKLGYHVSVLAPHHDWTPAVPHHSVCDGVEVWCTGQMHVRKIGSRKEYFSPVQLLRVSLQGATNTARLIRHVQPDVVHLGKPQPINGLAARWTMLFNRRLPLFVDCDDLEAESNRVSGAWQRRTLAYFENSLPRRARGVTVNTRFMQQRLEGLGVAAHKIVYVPNGIDRKRFAGEALISRADKWPGDSAVSLRILYLGSVELVSHPIDLLLDAMALVHQAEPRASLLIVGGGADLDKLRTRVSERRQSEYVCFLERVPPHETAAYYHAAHVTVDPVYDDRTAQARSPLKIVESLGSGTPVVTGDVGDRRWLLEAGAAGILVRPGDPHALAEGLLKVLHDSDLRRCLQLGALQARQHFWWDALVKDWLKVYSL